MTPLALITAVCFLTAPVAASANPCANGSFETLAPGGFPADWAPLGKVEVAADAHSGQRALRLVRTKEPPSHETGINGRNIDRLKGGIDFHYKAVAAKDVVLHIYAIPIAADGIEKTGAPRAAFAVPKAHVGDGQWHRARLKYDFTKNAKAKSVIFAARLEGTSGELLLDDFSYVERVGPMLSIGAIRIEEDPKQPGERCIVSAPVENAGDEPVKDVRVVMEVPKGLKADPAEVRLGDLAPDGKVPARYTLEGPRFGESHLKVTAKSGPVQAESVLRIAPEVVVKSWGPTSPVFLVGEPITVECELANVGNTIARKPRATFEMDGKRVTANVERLVPGQSFVLRRTLPPQLRPRVLMKLRGYWDADATILPMREVWETEVTVASFSRVPPPSGLLNTVVKEDCWVLENEYVRLAGAVQVEQEPDARPTVASASTSLPVWELCVKRASEWKRVAWLTALAGFTIVRPGNERSRNVPPIVDWLPSPLQRAGEAVRDSAARLRFTTDRAVGVQNLFDDAPDTYYWARLDLEIKPGARTITFRFELDPKKSASLVHFTGPEVFAIDRHEAIFPGLEWLVGNERSSDSLDIAESHPDRQRAIVHPNWVTIPAIGVHGRNGTVGLLWDVRQKWDGTRDRPGVEFRSPTTDYCGHTVQLFLPNPPGFVRANTREFQIARLYPLEPGKAIRLEGRIYADGDARDALSAIDEWIKVYGFPQPAPLPHGSYEKEIEFSMQAYLKSLWVPEEQKWWTSKGAGELLSPKGLPRSYVADLLLGEIVSPNPEVRRQCRARAEEVLKIIGGEPRLDAQRFPGRLDQSLADPTGAAGLLLSRGDDGAWRFDADQVGTGPFVGLDYHDLGPDNAAEVGLCAARATAVLRYARITGDWEAYRQMVKTLEFMEQFRVPRAAQVWEVPVHAPDILAAAEACEAYLEAYRFSGDKRWLRDAVTWARRGLPFVYLWNDPEKPFLVGASIPVFGATWMQGSWFGRPVQWNGLRYGEAILELAEYDQSYPWRQIAAAVTHSAIQQQEASGENVALWPDNIGAVNADKCPWVFAPRMILTNVLKLMGRDEKPSTVILGEGEKRLHISATANVADAAWDGSTCTFRATYPPGEQGVVVVFNAARPKAVLLEGKPLAEREDIESGAEPGWRYDEGLACLSIRIARDGASDVRIDGAAFRSVTRLPQLCERIAFEFDALEGWVGLHQVGDLRAHDGLLAGKITGPDPYLGRMVLRVRGDDCPVILLRMRVTGGGGGQLFWMTESSPAFTEDKALRLAVNPDGQFHEYRLEVGQHAAWSGQTITALRIDPCDGVASGEFAIDYVRGAK